MQLILELTKKMPTECTLRIVSTYLFIARYYDEAGNLVEDGVAHVHNWLNADPDNRIEIITNPVLTSDNFMAQSFIDTEMVPRPLFSPEQQG